MSIFRKRWFVAALLLATAVGFAPALVPTIRDACFESDVQTEAKPWTHLNFYNDPRNFQFAIVSDRTGGLRPGIFEDGIKKLNLLMPEFVMSVGDFIPGNTQDRAQLEKEWREFDAILEPLQVPFFFVPGNHDINNDVMREVWLERSGVPFYYFVYKDVLFLALDTTGEKGDIIPEYQVAYMKQVLEQHAAVRWTFVFMHHPLWLYDNPGGFSRIETLLEGRKHTVIAGHAHRYLHQWRNNSNYFILATTGGGSKLRGPRFGEFDHVTMVTVAAEGPVMVNLRLDGILPHDVTSTSDYQLTEALLEATELPYSLLADDEHAIREATIYLTLANPSDRPLQLRTRFLHDHQFTMEPAEMELTLAAKSRQLVPVALHSAVPVSPRDLPVVQLDWTMGYEFAGEEDLFLSGTRSIPLRASEARLIATVAPEFTGEIAVRPAPVEQGYTLRYTRDGSTPTVQSPEFASPLAVDANTTINTRLFNDQGHGTATCSQSYEKRPPGVGLRYRMYEGSWTRMPDFHELEPVWEGVATRLDVESREPRPDNWGMVLNGQLNIDVPGEYTFYVTSDDGSILYLDDQLVVDNDGDHSLLELHGTANLSAGSHDLRIEFFESGGEAILEVDMKGPGMPRQPLPLDRVTHDAPVAP